MFFYLRGTCNDSRAVCPLFKFLCRLAIVSPRIYSDGLLAPLLSAYCRDETTSFARRLLIRIEFAGNFS